MATNTTKAPPKIPTAEPAAASPWADPLAGLRTEHARLLEATREVDWLLAQRALSGTERLALDENMRTLRQLLPQHLVKEEFNLYPELRSAEPKAFEWLADLKQQHMVVEHDFAQLQAFVLAFDVGDVPAAMRRKASKAARRLLADLEALIAQEETAAFAAAQRGLAPEAIARMRAAFEAIDRRAALKQRHLR